MSLTVLSHLGAFGDKSQNLPASSVRPYREVYCLVLYLDERSPVCELTQWPGPFQRRKISPFARATARQIWK